MPQKLDSFIGRSFELRELGNFVSQPGSGFIYLRGRRRIGKSWLLEKLSQQLQPNCFLLSGFKDEGKGAFLERFAKAWDKFSGDSKLGRIRQESLILTDILRDISDKAEQAQAPLVLIFDEIQWLAKKNLGFVGALKQAWIQWELSGKVKVIVCGSSNKFFNDFQGGEEKILRGLKTQASIWLKPFSLEETSRYFFPSWSKLDVLLVQLLLGGVPYYLRRLDPDLPPLHSINKALFTSSTIFLEEVNELLSLEFNSKGVESVKSILSSLGLNGRSAKVISDVTGFSISHISETLNQLIDYKLVYSKYPFFKVPERNNSGRMYFMRDPFLNTYFSVLQALKQSIISNKKDGLIFPNRVLASKKGYYIPEFSGKAFEYFVWNLLENLDSYDNSFSRKMLLSGQNFEVASYWSKKLEIDLVIYSEEDRLLRLVECKWANKLSRDDLQTIQSKESAIKQEIGEKLNGIKLKSYLINPCADIDVKDYGITFVGIDDLF